MAQKEYIIKLSPVTAKSKFMNQNFEPVFVSKRNLEINALDTMLSYVSASKEKPADFNICADLISQLENLEDSETTWIITKGDLNLILDGFRETAKPEKRPAYFAKLKELFEQLENPTPRETKQRSKKDD
jgi:hypothetical protein